MAELIARLLNGTSLNEDESNRLLLEDYFGEDSPTSCRIWYSLQLQITLWIIYNIKEDDIEHDVSEEMEDYLEEAWKITYLNMKVFALSS